MNDSYKYELVNLGLRSGTKNSVVFLQPKGELVGPGEFVSQDTLVANTQGSSSLKLLAFQARRFQYDFMKVDFS